MNSLMLKKVNNRNTQQIEIQNDDNGEGFPPVQPTIIETNTEGPSYEDLFGRKPEVSIMQQQFIKNNIL